MLNTGLRPSRETRALLREMAAVDLMTLTESSIDLTRLAQERQKWLCHASIAPSRYFKIAAKFGVLDRDCPELAEFKGRNKIFTAADRAWRASEKGRAARHVDVLAAMLVAMIKSEMSSGFGIVQTASAFVPENEQQVAVLDKVITRAISLAT